MPGMYSRPHRSVSEFTALLVLLAGLCASAALGGPLDTWHERPTGSNGLVAVTFAEGTFVAAGWNGLVQTSPGGMTWATQASTASNTLHDVAHGGGTFVAVGEQGTIITSPDGTNWTTRVSGTTQRLLSVAHENGRFLVAGEPQTLLSSTDGVAWAAQATGQTFSPWFIADGGGLFILESAPGTVLVSPDGSNWVSRASPSSDGLYTMSFGGDRFTAIDIRNQVHTSPDAVQWDLVGAVDVIRCNQVLYEQGHYVKCGGGPMEYSRNGTSWTTITNGLSFAWKGGLAFGRGTFVVVGPGIRQSDPVILLDSPAPGELLIHGDEGWGCRIECTDQVDGRWEVVTNMTLISTPQAWSDPSAAGAPNRIYRARYLP